MLMNNIANALSGNVTGYVAIVGTQPPVYGGLARTAVNPPQTPMGPDLLMNVASISKTLTAVGVIQELQLKGLAIDDKVAPFYYTDWQPGFGIGPLTFKELMTHQSGFPDNDKNKCLFSSYAELKSQITGGIGSTTLPATAAYSNCNFALFRELLPIMEGFQILNFIPSPDTGRPPLSAAIYEAYMNQHVFAPLGIRTGTGGVTCAAPPSGATDVFSYADVAGSTPGKDWGDTTLGCGGDGWVLSANEVFRVIQDLAKGNVLLTNVQKQSMRGYFLGWDNAVRGDCGDINVCKDGGHGDPLAIPAVPIEATYAGILNCSIPVVVFANSKVTNFPSINGDIIDLVATAYNNAAVPVAHQPCP
jgi:hypothetical protein